MKKNFEILSLNEVIINELYTKCLPFESTTMVKKAQLYKNNPNHSTSFDLEKIMENRNTIYYLAGQLLATHQQSKEFILKSSIIKYNNKAWTKDMETLIHFLSLGIAASAITPIDDTTKAITLSQNTTPTLSPEDPNFTQWLKTEGKEWGELLGQEPSDD